MGYYLTPLNQTKKTQTKKTRTNMKNIFKFAASALVLSAFAFDSSAQVSATATATATIVTPIAITKDLDMSFGNLAVSGTPGTVELTPSNTRNVIGGVTMPITQGTVQAAKFTVTGQAGYTYAITLPTGSHTLESGANQMIADDFESLPNGVGTLTGGTSDLYVGATLHVGGTQAAGTYVSTAPFTVTVNYN